MAEGDSTPNPGTVLLSHLPHGFYKEEMKGTPTMRKNRETEIPFKMASSIAQASFPNLGPCSRLLTRFPRGQTGYPCPPS